MGQCDKALRLVVVDPDEAFRVELRTLARTGIEIVFTDPAGLTAHDALMSDRDVVVVCVASPAMLILVGDICARPDAPPVLAIGSAGFERKSLEHVLLLAELRGAVGAYPKPIEAAELVMAATQAQLRASGRQSDAREKVVTRDIGRPRRHSVGSG